VLGPKFSVAEESGSLERATFEEKYLNRAGLGRNHPNLGHGDAFVVAELLLPISGPVGRKQDFNH
jgi:hypothetical protein